MSLSFKDFLNLYWWHDVSWSFKQNLTERKSPSPFWIGESAKAGNARILFHHIFNDKLIVSS